MGRSCRSFRYCQLSRASDHSAGRPAAGDHLLARLADGGAIRPATAGQRDGAPAAVRRRRPASRRCLTWGRTPSWSSSRPSWPRSSGGTRSWPGAGGGRHRRDGQAEGRGGAEAASVGECRRCGRRRGRRLASAAAELRAPTPLSRGPSERGRRGGRRDAAFSAAALLTAVSELNQAILDEFADTPERLSAYQLGLALSDLTWLPCKPEPGTQGSAASRPSALVGLFSRTQLAAPRRCSAGRARSCPRRPPRS